MLNASQPCLESAPWIAEQPLFVVLPALRRHRGGIRWCVWIDDESCVIEVVCARRVQDVGARVEIDDPDAVARRSRREALGGNVDLRHREPCANAHGGVLRRIVSFCEFTARPMRLPRRSPVMAAMGANSRADRGDPASAETLGISRSSAAASRGRLKRLVTRVRLPV